MPFAEPAGGLLSASAFTLAFITQADPGASAFSRIHFKEILEDVEAQCGRGRREEGRPPPLDPEHRLSVGGEEDEVASEVWLDPAWTSCGELVDGRTEVILVDRR
jgi:hypothetical protein